MLDRLKSWLDAREDARRQQSRQASRGRGGDLPAAADDASAPRPTAARREGLRPRAGVGGAKASASAPAGGSFGDAYVLVTVGTTKFEALIKCVFVLLQLSRVFREALASALTNRPYVRAPPGSTSVWHERVRRCRLAT